MPAEAVDVVLTNKAYDGKTLLELMKTDFARGVYLNKITRGATSVNIPILAQTKVNRGDILRIAGAGAASPRPSRIWDTQTGRRIQPTWSLSVWAYSSAAWLALSSCRSRAFRSRCRHPAAR